MVDDRELAGRAKCGDAEAFDALVRRYQGIAFRAAYLVTGDAAEAEDAVQEGFVRAYAALDRFRPGHPFRPWLLRIVTNEARNRRRSEQRRVRLTQRLASLPVSQTASPEQDVLAAERRDLMLDELAGLSEMDRIMLTYHYFLDLSISEISTILETPESTTRTRLMRARNRLRDRFIAAAQRRGAGAVEPEHPTWRKPSNG